MARKFGSAAAFKTARTTKDVDLSIALVPVEANFRGWSHSLMLRLLDLLSPPVAPTAGPRSVLGGRAVYAKPNPWQLPDRAVVSLRA
jgi:hypothetical protein